ncbi:hypothetical protein BG004_008497, partial [Podila humilis]
MASNEIPLDELDFSALIALFPKPPTHTSSFRPRPSSPWMLPDLGPLPAPPTDKPDNSCVETKHQTNSLLDTQNNDDESSGLQSTILARTPNSARLSNQDAIRMKAMHNAFNIIQQYNWVTKGSMQMNVDVDPTGTSIKMTSIKKYKSQSIVAPIRRQKRTARRHASDLIRLFEPVPVSKDTAQSQGSFQGHNDVHPTLGSNVESLTVATTCTHRNVINQCSQLVPFHSASLVNLQNSNGTSSTPLQDLLQAIASTTPRSPRRRPMTILALRVNMRSIPVMKLVKGVRNAPVFPFRVYLAPELRALISDRYLESTSSKITVATFQQDNSTRHQYSVAVRPPANIISQDKYLSRKQHAEGLVSAAELGLSPCCSGCGADNPKDIVVPVPDFGGRLQPPSPSTGLLLPYPRPRNVAHTDTSSRDNSVSIP